MAQDLGDAYYGDFGIVGDDVYAAARICGPPMPKISTSARCFRAVARRAAYMSPLASPVERSRGIGVIVNFWRCLGDHLTEISRSRVNAGFNDLAEQWPGNEPS